MGHAKPQEDYATGQGRRPRGRVIDADFHQAPSAELRELRAMMKEQIKIDMQFMTADECAAHMDDMLCFVEALRQEMRYKRGGY